MYYSANEIIEIAKKIEENGYAFYTECFNKIDDEASKTLFKHLAQQEVGHIDAFEKIFKTWEPEDANGQDIDYDYLQFAADSHIFNKENAGKEKAKEITSASQAMDIALQFELDSVRFYEELLKKTKSDSKQIVDEILQEEKRHVEVIKAQMAK